MENRDVLELIDSLYTMVTEAWAVPLGNERCIIERDKVLAQLDQIKALLPRELAEANRIVAARDEFLGSAREESNAIRKSAEETAREMISEQYVVRQAQERSRELINNAETRARELYKVVNAYVDDRLGRTEEVMNSAAAVIGDARKAYRRAASPLERDPDDGSDPDWDASPEENAGNPEPQTYAREPGPEPGSEEAAFAASR